MQAHPDASGDVVTGTLSGNLLVWRARNCIKKVAGAHAGPVNSIHALAQRGMVSGGKDGTVVVWDTELRKGATFDIAALGSVDPAVRSVHWDSATHVVLIGTRGAEVFEMADTDGGDVNDDGWPCQAATLSRNMCVLLALQPKNRRCPVGPQAVH